MRLGTRELDDWFFCVLSVLSSCCTHDAWESFGILLDLKYDSEIIILSISE